MSSVWDKMLMTARFGFLAQPWGLRPQKGEGGGRWRRQREVKGVSKVRGERLMP